MRINMVQYKLDKTKIAIMTYLPTVLKTPSAGEVTCP